MISLWHRISDFKYWYYYAFTLKSCKNRSFSRKIFVDTDLESWGSILYDEIILGTIWVPHKVQFAFGIHIQNMGKSRKLTFSCVIWFTIVPRVVPNVLKSKSMMFELSKTVSTVLRWYFDKILQTLEFCWFSIFENAILWLYSQNMSSGYHFGYHRHFFFQKYHYQIVLEKNHRRYLAIFTSLP